MCLTSNDSSCLEIMMIRFSYDNFLLAPFANGCGFFAYEVNHEIDSFLIDLTAAFTGLGDNSYIT